MTQLLTTKEVARFLNVNEKMVYTLIAEKNLPATKITGKWMFPEDLVVQWIEINTINYPHGAQKEKTNDKLLIVAGSNDLLLSDTLSLFNRKYSDHLAAFANLGSMGGLRSLRQGLCHIAASHLLQEDEQEYNFEFAQSELQQAPAVVNFCHREQGLIVAKDNPKKIKNISSLNRKGVRLVNRGLGTGTRLLLDHELKKAGIDGASLPGYHEEKSTHLDVGLEILSGKADVGPGIRIVAHLLDLDFIPLRWERFDLLIARDRFFEKTVQLFLGLLQEEEFKSLYPPDSGYLLESSGKVMFPAD